MRDRTAYEEYLASAAWRRKRDLVMWRSGNICEGCLSAKATEVHHRTYDHVGDELLYELVAPCRACHGRAHAGRGRGARGLGPPPVPRG
jgi:hypothetical protein